MRSTRLAALILAALFLPAPAVARRGAGGHPEGQVVLDGEVVRVRWIDGDTFRIAEGPRRRMLARLAGVNALETFGPVHRWGGWAPAELLELARGTGAVAAAGTWRCASAGGDRYRRLLVECPDLAVELVRRGHAMVFAMDGPAAPGLLEAQRRAQAEGAGMWREGVPPLIVASAHSADERGLGGRAAYDRLVDTRTGAAFERRHHRTYAACEEVCAGQGPERACFLYVPYERRFRDRPRCLHGR